MAKKSKTQPRPRPVKVGDKVRLRIGSRNLVAYVVEDRGYVGVGGRQGVTLSRVNEAGEIERFDWPAEELTVLQPRRPARRRARPRS